MAVPVELNTHIGRWQTPATIAVGQSLSGAVSLYGYRLAAVLFPAAAEGTVLTFQGSADGTTFFDLYDSAGSEVSVTVAAGRLVVLTSAHSLALLPFPVLKVRTGPSAGPTVQAGADATLVLIGVPA